MMMTKEARAKRLRFLERRQGGIGGSDMPVILGLSTYIPEGRSKPLNALDVYYSKTRPIKEADIADDNIHQLRGHTFEGMALEHYMVKTGRECVGHSSDPTRHPDFPHMIVSIDFGIEPDEEREEGKRGRGTGETKSPVSSVFGNVIDHGIRQSEIIQLQTNIAVDQTEWGSFCFFSMEHKKGPVIAVDQMANPEMGRFLLETGQRFWDECVVPRIPPVPSEWKLLEAEGAPKIIDLSGEFTVIDDDDLFRALVERCLKRKDLTKEAEEQYRETLAQVFKYVTEYPCDACEGSGGDVDDVPCDACGGSGVTPLAKSQVPELARLTVVTKKGSVSRDWGSLQNAMPLDRDAVVRWLQGHRVDPESDLTDENIGRMLFECGLDLSLFESVGYQSQYLLANRSAK